MARNVAHYMDPDEEERLRLLEQEFGPPAPPAHSNLGVAPVPPLPLDDMPRRTDRDYSDFHDPYQDQEPTEEELAADAAHEEGGYEQIAPAAGERVATPEEAHPLDVFLTDPGRAANPYEEEAQAYAREQKQAAPRPVDDKAASVADEQKGVPAATKLSTTIDTGDELAWADELLAGVKKRVIDKPEASEGALYQQAEQFASDSLEPKKSFSREELASRALAAYGEDAPASRQWEDEFLRGRERFSDAEIRRRSALIGFFGDPEQGERWAAAQREAQQNYDEGLGKARDRDRKGSRISRGLASAIAATGMVPPEEAVKLTYGDDLVKNFGQYASQGGRAEGQQVGLEKARMHEAFGLIKSENADDRMRGIAMLQSLTQLAVPQARADAMQTLDPEQLRALGASWMQSGLKPLGANLTPEKAAAVLEGDRSGLTPEQAAKADALTPNIKTGLADQRVRGQVTADNLKAGVNADQKKENTVAQARSLAENDQKFALKFQSEWRAAEMPLKQAMSGWKAMSPAGKKAFVSFAQQQKDSGGILDMTTITDQLAKAFEYAPGDQVHASRVLAAINSYVKSNSGSAVTGSEWDRVAKRVGLATGTWAPFNDPEVVGTFLDDAARAMIEDRKDYERIMNGWK